IEMGNIVDAVEPIRQSRLAEARMRRCDEAALLGERRHEWLLRAKTSAAVQKQNGTRPDRRRPLAGIEQFKLDVRDSQLGRLHANASHGDTLGKLVAVGIALCRKRCTSTLRKECRRRNSCIALRPYTLK